MSDKRYLLFKSRNYEASGGMSDKFGDFSKLEEAIVEGIRFEGYDESHIYDRINGKIVWTKEKNEEAWQDIPAINDSKGLVHGIPTKEELTDNYVTWVNENDTHGTPALGESFIAGYESALSCFKEAPGHSLLLNALMLLDNEGLKSLADSIYSRINKEDKCQDNPIT